MYTLQPGMEEMEIRSDLERTAGTNQHHLVKLYIASTENVRVTITSSYKVEYSEFNSIHNYVFTTPMTPWLKMDVENPSLVGNEKPAQIIGQLDVSFVYDEPSTETVGLLPWWMP
jgi:hypothetical protein